MRTTTTSAREDDDDDDDDDDAGERELAQKVARAFATGSRTCSRTARAWRSRRRTRASFGVDVDFQLVRDDDGGVRHAMWESGAPTLRVDDFETAVRGIRRAMRAVPRAVREGRLDEGLEAAHSRERARRQSAVYARVLDTDR